MTKDNKHPYGWTRKPTYEELEKTFDRCKDLHRQSDQKLQLILEYCQKSDKIHYPNWFWSEDIKNIILEGKE